MFVDQPLANALRVLCFVILAAAPLSAANAANASMPAAARVVVSIKPLHSLVAAVTDGVSVPALLVDRGASPHGHRLRPSAARQLQQADVLFWIGPELERFLISSVARRHAQGKASLAMMSGDGIRVLAFREGQFASDEDDHEGHEEHAGHEHDEHGLDPHIWLDPQNAMQIVELVAKRLSALDADHAARYKKNAQLTQRRLAALQQNMAIRLSAVKHKPFAVFHDAYQYFERAFGLHNIAAITLDPEQDRSVAHHRHTAEAISREATVCLFAEPQFNAESVTAIAARNRLRVGELDPIGSAVDRGPEHYFRTLNAMADNLLTCLSDPAKGSQ